MIPYIVVLMYTSLIISNNEQLSMCLLAMCMFSLNKCLFRFSAQFLIGWFDFLPLNCMCCSYFGNLFIVDYIICQYFLPVCRLSFHFVYGFLCCVSLFYLWILNSSLYFLLVVFRKPSGGALTKYVAQNEQWLHAMLRERDKHKNKTALSIEVPEKASNVHNKK